MHTYTRIFGIISVVALAPLSFAFAQQLRVVEGNQAVAIENGIYRAYYGELTGSPQTFTLHTNSDIEPVNFVVLTPDTPEAKTNFSISMTDMLHPENPFTSVDGSLIEWQRFFDTAGRDSYLAGPMLQATVPRGDYEIRISNPSNEGRYVLVVSGEEPFSFGELMRRFGTLPAIKSTFFGKPAYQAYLTPLLLWPVIGVLLLVGVVVLLAIVFLRFRARR